MQPFPVPPVQYPKEGFDDLVRTLKETSGLDLTAYKERQTMRRLSGFLNRHQIDGWTELARRIRADDELRVRLTDHLAINVTEFFRNPERFVHLADEVLPALLQRFEQLRIWSAGCSIGAEPYSLAILLDELAPGSSGRHQVLGTDLDREALAHARKAVYVEDHLKEVSDTRRRQYFEPLSDGTSRVRTDIRNYVKFSEHNLLLDPYPRQQHLILCRNVIIYFTEEAKDRIISRFADSLVPGGYLLVGSTETIFRSERYGLRSVGPFLYERTDEKASARGN